jgi:hypothetical protein
VIHFVGLLSTFFELSPPTILLSLFGACLFVVVEPEIKPVNQHLLMREFV